MLKGVFKVEMSGGVSPLFVVKNWKFFLVFFSKIGENSVFCNLVHEKEAILDYKDTHFRKSKVLHFSERVSLWFLVKNWKFYDFLFFCIIGQWNFIQHFFQPFFDQAQIKKNMALLDKTMG